MQAPSAPGGPLGGMPAAHRAMVRSTSNGLGLRRHETFRSVAFSLSIFPGSLQLRPHIPRLGRAFIQHRHRRRDCRARLRDSFLFAPLPVASLLSSIADGTRDAGGPGCSGRIFLRLLRVELVKRCAIDRFGLRHKRTAGGRHVGSLQRKFFSCRGAAPRCIRLPPLMQIWGRAGIGVGCVTRATR